MRNIVKVVIVAVAGFGMTSAAHAGCSRLTTAGTAGDRSGAMVQAWEAQLQGRGWKGWPTFMAGGMRVGSAPGYRSASINRSSCKKGGVGVECVITATLCD